MKPTVELLLHDALQACARILQRIQLETYESFLVDEDLRESVYWNLAKLGEVLNQASNEDQALETLLPSLRSVVGLRNRIIHGYRNIDNEIVWLAASERVPELQNQIERMLMIDPGSGPPIETP
jgi:uncharacterized protein with HEPN domain